MAKFHIKENGEPGKCSAQAGNCPFGADAPHFSTQEDARTHFEHLQKITGGSFGATIATRPPTETVTLVDGDSREDLPRTQILCDLYSLDVGRVEEWATYQDYKDNMGDYDGDVLGVESTIRVFDDLGQVIHTEEHYAYVADDGDGELETRLYALLGEEDADTLTGRDELVLHGWPTENKRVTVRAFLHDMSF